VPGKIEAFGLLLVLLPGFLCAYTVQSLAVRRKQTEVDKVVEALIFSLILYLATLPWFGYTLPISWHEASQNSNSFLISLRWGQLCVLTLASILLGVIYAANINHDWLLRLFRLIRVTERTARSTIWNDVFHQIGGWVQVGLSEGAAVRGWLAFYSDEAEDSSLFLERAAWVGENGAISNIDGPGILITKEVSIKYIVFLRSREETITDAKSTSSDGGEAISTLAEPDQ
jgi:hypothetical protein